MNEKKSTNSDLRLYGVILLGILQLLLLIMCNNNPVISKDDPFIGEWKLSKYVMDTTKLEVPNIILDIKKENEIYIVTYTITALWDENAKTDTTFELSLAQDTKSPAYEEMSATLRKYVLSADKKSLENIISNRFKIEFTKKDIELKDILYGWYRRKNITNS